MNTKNNNTTKFYLPVEFRIYSHIIIAAASIFFCAIFYIDTSLLNWHIILPLSFLTFIFLIKPFLILSENINYYLDDIPIYASIFLLGAKSTLFIVLIGFTTFEFYKFMIKIFKREKINLSSFYLSFGNISHIMISSGISALIFSIINKNYPLEASFTNITAAAAASCVKFFLNVSESTFSTYLFERDLSFADIWKKNFSGVWVHLLMLAPLGFIFAYLISKNPFLSVFLTIPVIILYYACEAFKNTLRETNKIFQALVKSIDRRDHYTFGHSQRVSAYAKAIAAEMHLSSDDITTAESAGKIHDIGKIAISDDILQKTGKLNDEEAQKMRLHPAVSLAIFKNLHNLKKYIPAELASMHHERYDGGGYTLGLKGKQIPVISKIIAAADTFDAMTSERVYQRKKTSEEAVYHLYKAKGSQLDPYVVDALVKLHEKGMLEVIKSHWEESEKVYNKIIKSEELEEKYLNLKQVFN